MLRCAAHGAHARLTARLQAPASPIASARSMSDQLTMYISIRVSNTRLKLHGARSHECYAPAILWTLRNECEVTGTTELVLCNQKSMHYTGSLQSQAGVVCKPLHGGRTISQHMEGISQTCLFQAPSFLLAALLPFRVYTLQRSQLLLETLLLCLQSRKLLGARVNAPEAIMSRSQQSTCLQCARHPAAPAVTT